MGIIRAFNDSVSSTFADQWKEIITVGAFTEHMVVTPGIIKSADISKGQNLHSTDGIISNGSKIYVPENTAAFIFGESAIENIVTKPGVYVFEEGTDSVLNGNKVSSAIFGQIKDRFGYGGIPSVEKHIAFVNLREIRDIKFGTKGAQVYNDLFYGTDLEIFAYGSFTIKIVDPVVFIKNFVPANITYYSFDDLEVREQIISEFLHSFARALNSMSSTYRISQLPSETDLLSKTISSDEQHVGTWPKRFGFTIVSISIENIEFSEESRELVKQYSSKKMDLKAYEDISQHASNIAAQQKIAQGIQDNGLGNTGGVIYGMNFAQSLGKNAEQKSAISLDEQIETVKKLRELVDMGILTEEEFQRKKKEIMEL